MIRTLSKTLAMASLGCLVRTSLVLAMGKERRGVEVRPGTDREAKHYGMDTPQGGAVVEVDPKGALGQAGLEVPDLVLAIERASPSRGATGWWGWWRP
jgi:hypothetical protein